ncbi:MAG TPA: hypothetical protein VJT71_10875 [Pyrinomonadaceae bacterium]|nr:hypothetical protein [Pyrinomonadaceae bacterium]
MRKVLASLFLLTVLSWCLPDAFAQPRRRKAIRGNTNRAAIGTILGGAAGTGARARHRRHSRRRTPTRGVVEREQLEAVRKPKTVHRH